MCKMYFNLTLGSDLETLDFRECINLEWEIGQAKSDGQTFFCQFILPICPGKIRQKQKSQKTDENRAAAIILKF